MISMKLLSFVLKTKWTKYTSNRVFDENKYSRELATQSNRVNNNTYCVKVFLCRRLDMTCGCSTPEEQAYPECTVFTRRQDYHCQWTNYRGNLGERSLLIWKHVVYLSF